jgi:hypothetical protein
MLAQKMTIEDVQITVPERRTQVSEYDVYRHVPFRQYDPGDQVVFVLPEGYLAFLPVFRGLPVLVWWLSVDTGLAYFGKQNMNLLRAPHVYHAAQSAYAKSVLEALGIRSHMLGDYTNMALDVEKMVPLSGRPLKVALNAGGKVIVDLDDLSAQIAALCPGVDIVKITGMGQQAVYDAFASSRLYIDLGSFPGKDRMPREAALLGANILLARSGAGAYAQDYPIPEDYKIDPYDLATVAHRAAEMLNNPEVHAPLFAPLRAAIALEKENFFGDVVATFNALGEKLGY